MAMTFPLEHCVSTVGLSRTDCSKLISKLKLEGYKEQYPKEDKWGWRYVGVNDYGDIMGYRSNSDYISIDNEPFNNILTEEWLNKYLEE